jgi:hypothetical protein
VKLGGGGVGVGLFVAPLGIIKTPFFLFGLNNVGIILNWYFAKIIILWKTQTKL